MLETEEVDIDYFTPASSTSLSKIFSNTTQNESGQESNSLKYIPPLPTQVIQKPEEDKPKQCVLYVMTINAYEWLNDSYVSKERVGFVIIKIIQSDLHNIILYDSNKTILSCLTLTSSTDINVKENVCISFYDNQRKYWSVYTNPNEINKIIEILKGLNVNLKFSSDMEKSLCTKEKISFNSQQVSSTNETKNDNKESDTDSSVNRRTKDSILKRMATMGQSVLPPTHLITTQTSDSSDSNEDKSQYKTRHKPFKTNKRNTEKNIIEIDNTVDSYVKEIATKPINKNMFKNTNQQVITLNTMDIVKGPVDGSLEGNNMTVFISEQRVNNSELRINMNRITDKLDLVLEKVKDLDNIDRNSSGSNSARLQNEITYKLLNEYEKKIKGYEAFIHTKGFQCETFEPIPQFSNSSNDNYIKTNEVKSLCDCKEVNEKKDREILLLQGEVQALSSKLQKIELNDQENILNKEISELKQNIIFQNDQINYLNKQIEMSQRNEEVINKIKSIMNETFQTISMKFDNDTTYTGASVKTTVASIIKKTTMDSLKEIE